MKLRAIQRSHQRFSLAHLRLNFKLCSYCVKCLLCISSEHSASKKLEEEKPRGPLARSGAHHPILPHIPVTAFSRTDLFLVLIYREFRPPQEPQWPITSTVLIFNWRHHFTGRSDGLLMWGKDGKPFFFLTGALFWDSNWSISREQKPTEKSTGLETRRTNKELSVKKRLWLIRRFLKMMWT